MRTLKKALSLVLVLAMVFTLAVPALAVDKAADFKDYDKVTNKEAVDVLTAIGVINGNADGTFGADAKFTRAQGATMIAYLTLGKTVADALPTSATKFSDVPANFWGAKYIQYCANEGIINGYGNGKFGPDDELTSAQWALMLLGALGYQAKYEGIGGAGWEIAATKLAMQAGVASADDMVGTMTRDTAAKMAFNTLKAKTVAYSSGVDITTGDTSISVNATRGYVLNGAATETINDDGYMQFAEQHFTKLEITEKTVDAFGRPADKWANNGKVIGAYSQDAVASFNGKTSANDVASKLGGYSLLADGLNYSVNNTTTATSQWIFGDKVVNNAAAAVALTVDSGKTVASAIAALTANGKLVEVFADDQKQITKIVTVEYTVGDVNKVTTTNRGVTYSINNVAYNDFSDENVADTIVLNGAIEKGDAVTMVVIGGKAYVYPTTTVTGAQSSFNTGKETVTVDGTVYTVGTGVKTTTGNVAIPANSNKTNTYYLDQFGYVVKSTSAAVSTDYARILNAYGSKTTTIDGSTPKIEVRAVLSDGTVDVYTVALTNTNGTYKITNTDIVVTADNVEATAKNLVGQSFGYTLSDKTISLETLALANGSMTEGNVYKASVSDVNAGTVVLTTGQSCSALVDSNTKYIVYDAENKTAKVYTGNTSLPTGTKLNGASVVMTANSKTAGTASVVFVAGTVNAASTTDYVYIDSAKFSTALDQDNKTTYVYTGTKADGTTIELTAKAQLAAPGLYSYTTENTVADANKLCGTGDTSLVKNLYVYDATLETVGSLVVADGKYYNITADTQIVYVNSDLYEVNGNGGYVVLAASNGQATLNVATIYVTVD